MSPSNVVWSRLLRGRSAAHSPNRTLPPPSLSSLLLLQVPHTSSPLTVQGEAVVVNVQPSASTAQPIDAHAPPQYYAPPHGQVPPHAQGQGQMSSDEMYARQLQAAEGQRAGGGYPQLPPPQYGQQPPQQPQQQQPHMPQPYYGGQPMVGGGQQPVVMTYNAQGQLVPMPMAGGGGGYGAPVAMGVPIQGSMYPPPSLISFVAGWMSR
jgi:hypothetical protein